MPLIYKRPNISILKCSKIRVNLPLWHTKEPLVSLVSTKFQSRLWKATSTTQVTEAKLNFHQIRGLLNRYRSGFGNIKSQHLYLKKDPKPVTNYQQKITGYFLDIFYNFWKTGQKPIQHCENKTFTSAIICGS